MKNRSSHILIFILLFASFGFSYPISQWPTNSGNCNISNVSSTFGPRNLGSVEWSENNWEDNNNNNQYNYDFHRGIDIIMDGNFYAITDCYISEINEEENSILLISLYTENGEGKFLYWRYTHIEKASWIINDYYGLISRGTLLGNIEDKGSNTHLDIKFYDNKSAGSFATASHPLQCLDYFPNENVNMPTADNLCIYSDNTGTSFGFDLKSDNDELDIVSLYISLIAYDGYHGLPISNNVLLLGDDENNSNEINFNKRYNCGDGTTNDSDDGYNNHVRILPYIYSYQNGSKKINCRFYLEESRIENILDNRIFTSIDITDCSGNVVHVAEESYTGFEDTFSIEGPGDELKTSQSVTFYGTFCDDGSMTGMSGVTWYLCALTNNGLYLLQQQYTEGNYLESHKLSYEYNFQVPSLIGRGQVWTRDQVNTDYVQGVICAQGVDSDGCFQVDMMDVLIYHKVVGHDTPLQPICGWDHEVLVEDTVTVDVNTILTINNGTIVKFAPNAALLVQGQLFANQVTFEAAYEDDWAGLIFNGDYSSPSRILNCVVKDCIDGFTITNASPIIKTTEIKNIFKRGFNIIGIDAEPEVRLCYIHNTGTYPLQMLSESDPIFVDNRLYGGGKTAARIWGADGTFSRNEFRSAQQSGVFTFSSTAAPKFFSIADSGGNMFDMEHIGTQAFFIGGGTPLFGQTPNIVGNNTFKNRGSRYYIYNDTPQEIKAELNWWANGTGAGSFFNAEQGGRIDFSPKLDNPPFSGPILHLKTAASPYSSGLEKYHQKDYAGAMEELKQSLQRDKTSIEAAQAVFHIGKAARKIGRLGELESFLGDLKKEKDPQIQYHSRNWLCYLYASRNDMKSAEKLLDELPKGSSLERTMLLDLCSYYASWKDMKNAERIAAILKARHNNEVLDMELEAALEGWVNFTQVKGQTKLRRAANEPILAPELTSQTETDTVALKFGVYPNPFNSSTTINYKVEKDGPVQIAIYDVLGRLVQTLVDERRTTGSYRAIWNGQDELGHSVASGIYFVRMQMGDAMQSWKISYIK